MILNAWLIVWEWENDVFYLLILYAYPTEILEVKTYEGITEVFSSSNFCKIMLAA